MAKIPPAWFLFFFAPLTVEYVSGSSPYLNPFVHVANLLLYGAGTILIREARVRWRKGWLAVFILSLAYMIAEEGLMLNTLFDPTKNNAGRLIGVNWVWTSGMLVVHSLMSIFAPILFVEAAYHEKADEPWVTPRTIWVLLVLFAANIFGLGRLIAPLNRPGVLVYAMEFALIAACIFVARIGPGPAIPAKEAIAVRSPRWLFMGALIGFLITMATGLAAPSLPIPAAARIFIMLTVYALFLVFLRRIHAFDHDFDPLSRYAVAAGMISSFIAASPLISLGKQNPGPIICGVVAAIILVRVRARIIHGASCPGRPPTAGL